MDCISQLKQIGMALHNFEGTYKRLPPLFAGGATRAGKRVAVWSEKFDKVNGAPHVLLLPYIEQDRLYGLMSADGVIFVPSHPAAPKQANQHAVMTYICPFEPGHREGIQLGSSLGGTSYAANGQLFGSADSATGLPLENSPWDSALSIARIKDGSSNTIAFAHVYTRCGAAEGTATSPASGAVWGYYNGGLAPAGTQGPPIFMNAVISGAANVGPRITAHFQVAPVPFTRDAAGGQGCDPALPVGAHHGGNMMVLLADGSVRTVSPSVSPFTWWLACSPDDGQGLPADW